MPKGYQIEHWSQLQHSFLFQWRFASKSSLSCLRPSISGVVSNSEVLWNTILSTACTHVSINNKRWVPANISINVQRSRPIWIFMQDGECRCRFRWTETAGNPRYQHSSGLRRLRPTISPIPRVRDNWLACIYPTNLLACRWHRTLLNLNAYLVNILRYKPALQSVLVTKTKPVDRRSTTLNFSADTRIHGFASCSRRACPTFQIAHEHTKYSEHATVPRRKTTYLVRRDV